MATVIVKDRIEALNRLEQLGWSMPELLEVVGAMVSARNSCTDNDPSSARGWMAWKEGTRRLRELGLPKGLMRLDDDQIPWTVDLERGIKITVANTDDATGDPVRIPQNRNRKGPGTDRAVHSNQSSFFDRWEMEGVVPLSRAGRQPGILVAWYLLVYSDGDAVRAEFSCPAMTSGGYFTDFLERILLVGPEHDFDIAFNDTPSGDGEIDVPVSRK